MANFWLGRIFVQGFYVCNMSEGCRVLPCEVSKDMAANWEGENLGW